VVLVAVVLPCVDFVGEDLIVGDAVALIFNDGSDYETFDVMHPRTNDKQSAFPDRYVIITDDRGAKVVTHDAREKGQIRPSTERSGYPRRWWRLASPVYLARGPGKMRA
jgi:hypothetical protein